MKSNEIIGSSGQPRELATTEGEESSVSLHIFQMDVFFSTGQAQTLSNSGNIVKDTALQIMAQALQGVFLWV